MRGAGARGWELLLSPIRQRSIRSMTLAEDILQPGISWSPTGRSGRHHGRGSFAAVERSMWDRLLGRANEVQIGIRSRST